MFDGIAKLPAAVFVFLALLHFHWALGGRFAFEGAVPSVEGKPLFVPGPGASAALGLALLAAALVDAWRAGVMPLLGVPMWIPHLGIWVLALVFAARAVGDFRYVGFFKRQGRLAACFDASGGLEFLLERGAEWVSHRHHAACRRRALA